MPPGPSFVREEELRLPASRRAPERVVRLGMTRPTSTDDAWWLAVMYAHDDGGIVRARDLAPPAGPPPQPPLAVLGPGFAGALSGLIAEERGRQAVRLRLPEGAPDAHPWDRLMIVQVAIKWEPLRVATLQAGELSREVLGAFRRALEVTASSGAHPGGGR